MYARMCAHVWAYHSTTVPVMRLEDNLWKTFLFSHAVPGTELRLSCLLSHLSGPACLFEISVFLCSAG